MASTTTTAAVMLLIVSSLLGNTMSSTFVETMGSTFVASKSGVPLAVPPVGLLYAAALTSVSLSAYYYSSQKIVPSVNVTIVPLQECEEEFDMTIREAKLALRFTDVSSEGASKTDSYPKMFQHWALVVHFPRGKKTYLFEAWKNESNGLLQPTRAEGAGYEVFEKATYFATTETSPKELLRKAKQVETGEYNILFNNCQTWLKEFVRLISLELSIWPSFDQNHADIWTKFNLESHIFRFFAS